MDTTTSRNYLNGGTLATPATVEYGTRDSRFQYRESPRTVDRSDGVYPHRRQGCVSAFHGLDLDGEALFLSHVQRHDGPVSATSHPPVPIKRVLNANIKPGQIFDVTPPLDQVPKAYRAMDERRAMDALPRLP